MKLFNAAHALATSYLGSARERRVYPGAAAIEGLQAFDEVLPDQSCPMETLTMLDQAGSPACVTTGGGRYFGFVTGGSLPIATAADWMVTAWDQLGTLPISSPAVAKIEAVAGRWVREILGLPEEAVASFVTGASAGNLMGLAAARAHLYRGMGYDTGELGLTGAPAITVVACTETHSTTMKALRILGFGRNQIRLVDADRQGRMRADHLPPLDGSTILVLQAGNVNSGASDPFPELIAAARRAGTWVHVDGAFGLWAAAAPGLAHQVQGMELADSWATDAHKWLNVPYDCGIFICRHSQAVHDATGFAAAYAPTSAPAAKDVTPEFSRRARGVPVWAALRTLGRSGVADLVERCCAHARALADGLKTLGFDVHNEVVLNQIVASIGDAAFTEAVRKRVEEQGVCWFGPTHWQGRAAVRFSVSSWATTEEDITIALEAIAEAVATVRNLELPQ